MKKLSVNENLVIQELFKNPHLSLDDLANSLNNASERRTLDPNKSVDLRSVSKFKSVGYKKIREGLLKLADDFRLDYSLQSENEDEKKKEKAVVDLLLRNGIFLGHDYRIDKKITFFFSIKDQSIIPWQDHICNRNCELECSKILSLIRHEHGLKTLNVESPFREFFEKTINEIVLREMN
ncbi:MAG: hypothetical protein ACW97P_01805 [Candidatus Hodarchaeales archaeon]|jgi:hypothetical protein